MIFKSYLKLMMKLRYFNEKTIFYCRYSQISNVYSHQNCVETCSCLHGTKANVVNIVSKNFKVYENFVSDSEETELLKEIDPLFKRRRYEFDHWDDAIQGYKETDKLQWNEANSKIIDRIRTIAFSQIKSLIKEVHILDLSKTGYIKPHVDSFCGDTIAGISLLSSCVMRLVCENDKSNIVDALLPRCSLYIMKGDVRYNFTHEILKDELSIFKDQHIPRDRRVSIICRNEPNPEDAA